jgi:cobalt-zinc-cadmium efflux system membrane fusion protein
VSAEPEVASSPVGAGHAARSATPNGAAKSKKRLLTFGALGLVAAGALAWTLVGRKDPAVTAAKPLDTPRVEGQDIRYSKKFAERSGIKLAPVVTASLVPVVNAVGTIDFDPEYVAAIGTRLRGLVTRVEKFEGDSVDVGTVLAVIESGDLGEAQASVSTLEAEKVAADLNLKREKELADKHLSTAREAELAAAEAERAAHLLAAARQKVSAIAGHGSRSTRFGAHELRSPLKGTVVERKVSPGQAVEGELVAFRVANTEHLWVGVDVFEKNIGLVKLGDRVDLSPLATPGDAFEGRVARIGALIDAESHSAEVRVEVDNRDGRLRAGQAVDARIHGSARGERPSVLVPTTAITFVDGRPTVFLSTGEGAVRVVEVEIGFADGSRTEVKSGLTSGQTVVSEGIFALKSELFR